MAALDRCRSYRQENDPPCKIIAMGDHLVSDIKSAEYNTKVLKIVFSCSGFDGSRKASLSYEPSATRGHIWLVDKTRGRDCKGQWYLSENQDYLWHIKCFDGLKASGSLDSPLKRIGVGRGKDNSNREIVFTFGPGNTD